MAELPIEKTVVSERDIFTISHRFIDEYGKTLSILEQQFRIRIQPKPKWLPQRVWWWLLSKILVLDVFHPHVTQEAYYDSH